MRPEDAWLMSQRLKLWRQMPDVVSHPRVDWSPRAARRSGYVAPAGGARDPGRPASAARPGAAAAGGAPIEVKRVAIIRIDFATDRGGDRTTGNGRFDLSGPDPAAPPIDRPPRNRAFYEQHLDALSRYYWAESYGRVAIQGDVWPRDPNAAYTVSDMEDFGPWEFSRNVYPQALHMLRTFLFAADSQSIALNDRIPWSSYDRFIVVHAGSDLQDDVRRDSPGDIPTFTIGAADSDRVFFASDTAGVVPPCDPGDPNTPCFSIDRAMIAPETINQDGYFGTLNGVLAHESGHLIFGLDDVYNFETGDTVVGEWSLMDSGNLVGSQVLLPDNSILFATGLLPPSIDPWQRFFVGDALDFTDASLVDTTVLDDSERHPDMRRVPLSSDEYLLLENRYQLPQAMVELAQDTVTHVILGPKPDSLLYDALLPGGGVLVWHIDQSVLPFGSSLRINPDGGFNTNPARLGISVIEADGLGDLGDPGSSEALGGPGDPWFRAVNPVLSDSTFPNLVPHIGTRTHLRLDFPDEPDSVMHVVVSRQWQLPGWPVRADFPPGGPRLLAVDADGDRNLEVCWAGGADSILSGLQVVGDPDSAALFAVRVDGSGFHPQTGSYAFARLDQISLAQRGRTERRPRPRMAALERTDLGLGAGAWFAVSTYSADPAGADTAFAGGRVWLVDTLGEARPGWPALLPTAVTTPPVILGSDPNAAVFVGCADGQVYALDLQGQVLAVGGPLSGPVSGRLAVNGSVLGAGILDARVAAGSAVGDVAVLDFTIGGPRGAKTAPVPTLAPVWIHRVGASGFTPDFLWLDLGGAGSAAGRSPVCAGDVPALVVHHADRLWAFCGQGELIPGWGQSAGDTLVDALAAGDPDGDGFPDVLTQTVHSQLAFWSATGAPPPGWPRAGTREDLRTSSPPLALDVDGDGRAEIVGLNGSGILAALDGAGHAPPGWPLATGAGCQGDPVAADLDRNGSLEVVAPDRFSRLYAYSLPGSGALPVATSWTMVGGDPGRTSALPASRTTTAAAPAAGPLVHGSLKAYPNPARRHPVTIAYELTEPAQVEVRVLDTSGHEVASFERTGIQSSNVFEWDPGRLPAGLYLVRLRFRGGKSEGSETIPVGVLR